MSVRSKSLPPRPFAVWVVGNSRGDATTVLARSAGAAKYQRLLDLDGMVSYTDLRAVVLGGYSNPPGFRHCVEEHRSIPFVTIMMRARLDDGREGYVVGHDSSCNLLVLFDGDNYPLSCHPAWQIAFQVGLEWRRAPGAEIGATP